MANCMNCRHAAPARTPDGRLNFAVRMCVEGPPTPLFLPDGRLMQAYPTVDKSTPPCSRFDERLAGEVLAAEPESERKPQ